MTFSKPADGRITGHNPDGGAAMGYEGRFCTHASCCGRGFATSVTAANHCNVESVHHQDLGWRVVAKARGGVKSIGFIENVSRETFRLTVVAPKLTNPQVGGEPWVPLCPQT